MSLHYRLNAAFGQARLDQPICKVSPFSIASGCCCRDTFLSKRIDLVLIRAFTAEVTILSPDNPPGNINYGFSHAGGKQRVRHNSAAYCTMLYLQMNNPKCQDELDSCLQTTIDGEMCRGGLIFTTENSKFVLPLLFGLYQSLA